MSAHKNKGLATTRAGIVVGDGKHLPHPRRRLIILIIIALLIVAVVAVAAILVTKHVEDDKNTLDRSSGAVAAAEKPTPEDLAYRDSLNGKPQALQDILDEQLTKATVPQQKVDVYVHKMSVALNAKQYDAAIKYGNEADKILKTSETAQTFAAIDQAEGDKSTAKAWLQKAIGRLDESSPSYGRAVQDLQEEIERLK